MVKQPIYFFNQLVVIVTVVLIFCLSNWARQYVEPKNRGSIEPQQHKFIAS